MSDGLLSLQWNNHKSTLHHMLLNVRRKERYTDTTLACDGKLYPVHKLVLSMCSDYFEQIFAQIECTKHPVIVLKDIKQDELECLLNYMYVGEVNVVQERLSGLIKAAECLRIKGLAVPDEEPSKETCKAKNSGGTRDKRASEDGHSSSDAKRRKQETNFSDSSSRQSNFASQFRNEDSRRLTDRSSTNTRHRNGTSSNSHNISNNGNNISKVNNNTNSANNKRKPLSERTEQISQSSKPSSEERQRRGSSSSRGGRDGQDSPLPEVVSTGEEEAGEEDDIKTEETVEEPITAQSQQEELVIDEPPLEVKAEPNPDDDDGVYIADINSDEGKGMMFDNLAGDPSAAGGSDSSNQMHFMEELLNQTTATEQGIMGVGDYGDTGEGTSSSAGQHITYHYGKSDRWRRTSSVDGRAKGQDASLSHLPRQDILSLMHGSPLGRHAKNLDLFPASSQDDSGYRKQVEDPSRQVFVSGDGSFVPFSELDVDSLLTEQRTYQCPGCPKQCGFKSELKIHYMTHSGEKPYKCSLCLYGSNQKSHLYRHMEQMHSPKARVIAATSGDPSSSLLNIAESASRALPASTAMLTATSTHSVSLPAREEELNSYRPY